MGWFAVPNPGLHPPRNVGIFTPLPEPGEWVVLRLVRQVARDRVHGHE